MCCGGFRAAEFFMLKLPGCRRFLRREIGDAYAAFEAGTDFAGVVLKAFERAELGGVDHYAVANNADLPVRLRTPRVT